jgi:hypothetical protein
MYMETIINIALFCATTFSIAWIISREFIFKWLRNALKPLKFIHKLISCSNCLSVWTGAITALFWPVLLIQPFIINVVVGAMLSYFFMKIMSIWINNNEITLED